MSSISETADRAADILETQGHIKNSWGNKGEPRCLGGAISQAIDEIRGFNCFSPIIESINDMVGLHEKFDDFVDWNNAPERKPEEVIQVLRDVATKHRSDAMTVKSGE